MLRLKLVAIALPTDLKPLHGVPGGILQAQGFHPAQLLVGSEYLGDLVWRIAEQLELAGQLDGILNRQFGARADREVGCVHGIAHQHDVAAIGILEPPLVANDPLEVQPSRTSQMTRVGHQVMALQCVFEHMFAKCDGLLLIGPVQTMCQPDMFRTLDDERGGVLVELVDVCLKPAMLGFLEVKGEGIVKSVCAQPDISVRAGDDVRLEDVLILCSDAGVDPVTGDNQVSVWIIQVRVGFGFKHQLDPESLAASLQDVEQLFAADADEPMSPGSDGAPLEQQLNVVPMIECIFDLIGCFDIPLPHVFHGGI